MLETTLGKITFIGSLIGVILLLAVAVYAFYNDSGHSSASPYVLLAVFVPLVVDGVISLVISIGTDKPLWVSIAALSVGIVGILFLLWLDRSNTLVQYEVWLQRGMP